MSWAQDGKRGDGRSPYYMETCYDLDDCERQCELCADKRPTAVFIYGKVHKKNFSRKNSTKAEKHGKSTVKSTVKRSGFSVPFRRNAQTCSWKSRHCFSILKGSLVLSFQRSIPTLTL